MSKNNSVKTVDNNKETKPLKSKKSIIFLTITGILLIYCVFLFIKLISNPTEKFIVEQGKIYKEETQVGYVIRNEEIVQSEDSGR